MVTQVQAIFPDSGEVKREDPSKEVFSTKPLEVMQWMNKNHLSNANYLAHFHELKEGHTYAPFSPERLIRLKRMNDDIESLWYPRKAKLWKLFEAAAAVGAIRLFSNARNSRYSANSYYEFFASYASYGMVGVAFACDHFKDAALEKHRSNIDYAYRDKSELRQLLANDYSDIADRIFNDYKNWLECGATLQEQVQPVSDNSSREHRRSSAIDFEPLKHISAIATDLLKSLVSIRKVMFKLKVYDQELDERIAAKEEELQCKCIYLSLEDRLSKLEDVKSLQAKKNEQIDSILAPLTKILPAIAAFQARVKPSESMQEDPYYRTLKKIVPPLELLPPQGPPGFIDSVHSRASSIVSITDITPQPQPPLLPLPVNPPLTPLPISNDRSPNRRVANSPIAPVPLSSASRAVVSSSVSSRTLNDIYTI